MKLKILISIVSFILLCIALSVAVSSSSTSSSYSHFLLVAWNQPGHYAPIHYTAQELLKRDNTFVSIITTGSDEVDVHKLTGKTLDYSKRIGKENHLNIIKSYGTGYQDKQSRDLSIREMLLGYEKQNIWTFNAISTLLQNTVSSNSRTGALTVHEYLIETQTIQPPLDFDEYRNKNNDIDEYNINTDTRYDFLGNYHWNQTGLLKKYFESNQFWCQIFAATDENGNVIPVTDKSGFEWIHLGFNNYKSKKIDLMYVDFFQVSTLVMLKYFTFKYDIPIVTFYGGLYEISSHLAANSYPINIAIADIIKETIFDLPQKYNHYKFLHDLNLLSSDNVLNILWYYSMSNNLVRDMIYGHNNLIANFDYPMTSIGHRFKVESYIKRFGYYIPNSTVNNENSIKMIHNVETKHPILYEFLQNKEYEQLPIVLISFGSFFTPLEKIKLSLFNVFKLNCLYLKKYRVIWKISKDSESVFNLVLKELKTFEKETGIAGKDLMYITHWMPQIELLSSKKIDLFITHGGANSVQEALLCEIKMLLMPQMFEQHENSVPIDNLGCGIIIPPSMYINEDIKGEKLDNLISNKINRILFDETNKFDKNCGKLNQLLLKSGDVNDIVDYFEYLVQEKEFLRDKPYHVKTGKFGLLNQSDEKTQHLFAVVICLFVLMLLGLACVKCCTVLTQCTQRCCCCNATVSDEKNLTFKKNV